MKQKIRFNDITVNLITGDVVFSQKVSDILDAVASSLHLIHSQDVVETKQQMVSLYPFCPFSYIVVPCLLEMVIKFSFFFICQRNFIFKPTKQKKLRTITNVFVYLHFFWALVCALFPRSYLHFSRACTPTFSALRFELRVFHLI